MLEKHTADSQWGGGDEGSTWEEVRNPGVIFPPKLSRACPHSTQTGDGSLSSLPECPSPLGHTLPGGTRKPSTGVRDLSWPLLQVRSLRWGLQERTERGHLHSGLGRCACCEAPRGPGIHRAPDFPGSAQWPTIRYSLTWGVCMKVFALHLYPTALYLKDATLTLTEKDL